MEETGVPLGVTDGGTNAQLAPVGRPAEHVRVTTPVKPFSPLTEMVYVAGLPAATEAVPGGDTLTEKSGIGASKNATACITQAVLAFWVAVPSIMPTGGPTRCSTLSPSGVTFTVMKAGPLVATAPPTVFPAPIIRSLALVVVIGPLSSAVPVQVFPPAVSSGVTGSSPLYSSTRTSGDAAAALKVTVTVLLAAAMMFFA